jgi:hypothetical protein
MWGRGFVLTRNAVIALKKCKTQSHNSIFSQQDLALHSIAVMLPQRAAACQLPMNSGSRCVHFEHAEEK